MSALAVAPGRFLYFAYGSNMCSPRLLARTPSAVAVGIGSVEGRRLNFHKCGRDGSGKCSIEPSNHPAERVWGVLYDIAAAEQPCLDAAEGLGVHYAMDYVTVHRPGTGPAQALTYVACALDPNTVAYDWYHAYVLHGAQEHGLPADYIAAIAQVAHMADPDPQRSASHWSRLLPVVAALAARA